MQTTSPAFKENARRALVSPGLQKSLARSKTSFQAKRTAAVMGLPEFERLRDIGREIKNHTLAHLDFYLEQYAEAVERAGGTVHWCSTADDARAAVRAHLDAIPRTKGFGNGREARNLFEEAVARQASRIVAMEPPTDEQLTTLEAQDVPPYRGERT